MYFLILFNFFGFTLYAVAVIMLENVKKQTKTNKKRNRLDPWSLHQL